MNKNNGVKQRESVTKNEITDITMHIDKFTETDKEFFKAFTLDIFRLFGWTYYTKKEEE